MTNNCETSSQLTALTSMHIGIVASRVVGIILLLNICCINTLCQNCIQIKSIVNIQSYTNQVNIDDLLYANYRKLHNIMLQSDLMICFIHNTLINPHPYTPHLKPKIM